jgi:hypothetical protein
LIEIQSSVSAELRQYNDQALPLLKRLRSDVKAAARAMEAFAGSFGASGMDLDGEVKRELQRLDKAARSDDLSEIRDVIRAASSSIASGIERLRESNQLATFNWRMRFACYTRSSKPEAKLRFKQGPQLQPTSRKR